MLSIRLSPVRDQEGRAFVDRGCGGVVSGARTGVVVPRVNVFHTGISRERKLRAMAVVPNPDIPNDGGCTSFAARGGLVKP